LPEVTCKKCGSKLRDEFRYCFNCGNLLVVNKTPSESRQGAVIGGFVGLLYGAFYTISWYIVFPEVSAILPKSAPTLFSSTHVLFAVASPPTCGLFGAVLGVMFVKFRKHILGTSIIEKSVIFGFILMTISFILSLRPGMRVPSIHFTAEQYTLGSVLVVANYVALPLLGWLFGYLLQRRLKSQGI